MKSLYEKGIFEWILFVIVASAGIAIKINFPLISDFVFIITLLPLAFLWLIFNFCRLVETETGDLSTTIFGPIMTFCLLMFIITKL